MVWHRQGTIRADHMPGSVPYKLHTSLTARHQLVTSVDAQRGEMLARGHPDTGTERGFPPSVSHPIFSLSATAPEVPARLHQPFSSSGPMTLLTFPLHFPKINRFVSFVKLVTVLEATKEESGSGNGRETMESEPRVSFPMDSAL